MADRDKEQAEQYRFDASTVQMVLKETKDLIRALEGTRTRWVKVRAGSLEIEVERRQDGPPATTVPAGAGAVTGAAVLSALAAAPGLMPIVAPLVGVFYRSVSPGAKPFVEVGDTVERGQQVGIVEAMKMMNEVTSDYRGVVMEILVVNGAPVQYEQRLMLIDTTGSPRE